MLKNCCVEKLTMQFCSLLLLLLSFHFSVVVLWKYKRKTFCLSFFTLHLSSTMFLFTSLMTAIFLENFLYHAFMKRLSAITPMENWMQEKRKLQVSVIFQDLTIALLFNSTCFQRGFKIFLLDFSFIMNSRSRASIAILWKSKTKDTPLSKSTFFSISKSTHCRATESFENFT